MSTTNFLAQSEAQLIVETLLNSKAPNNHASSATTYGLGSSANYGHVKVINNLTTSSSTNGEALSAYQGYILNEKIDDVTKIVHCICSTSASAQVKTITIPQGVILDDGDILLIHFANTNTYSATANNDISFSINTVDFDVASEMNPSTSAITKPLGVSPEYYGKANTIHAYKIDLTHLCLVFLGNSKPSGGGVEVSTSSTEPSNPSDKCMWLGGS